MKVYIVLRYYLYQYGTEFEFETCVLDRVYRSRKSADKRRRYLENKAPNHPRLTYHTIEKTLKGRPNVS